VSSRIEQIRLARIGAIPVALVAPVLAIQVTSACYFVTKSAFAARRLSARRIERAPIAERPGAIPVRLVAIPHAIGARGAGTEAIVAAHLALAVRRRFARLTVAAPLAPATAIDRRLVAVLGVVQATGLETEVVDAVALGAVERSIATLTEVTAVAVVATAVAIGLTLVRVRHLVAAVPGVDLLDEVDVGRRACERRRETDRCSDEGAAKTRQAKRGHQGGIITGS
jgi:hypothetical protein